MLHWWTVLPAHLYWRILMTCHESTRALKAPKLWRSVKKNNGEKKHQEFSLSTRTSFLSEHHYGLFLMPPLASALKLISLFLAHSKWFINISNCSLGQVLGHRGESMQRGWEILPWSKCPAALIQISGLMQFSCFLFLSPSPFSAGSHHGAESQW